MASGTIAARQPDVGVAAARAGGASPKRSRPIVWWVAAGCVHFALAIYILIRWLTSGQLHRTDAGDTPMKGYVRVALDIATWASPILGLAIVGWFLVRPLVQRRGLTTEGMLLLACLCLYFPYDIVNDYTANLFQYNAHFWNRGSWLGAIPGTLLPNAYKVPEPIFFMLPAYAWGVFMPCIIGAWCLRRLRARKPHLSNAAIVGIVLLGMCVIDLILEGGVIQLEIEGYPGASHPGSLNAGSVHQFPAYETLLIGLIYIGGACLLFFRDDKGRTFAERGVDRIGTTPKQRTGARLLATIGFMVVVELFAFDIPIQWFATHGGSFPASTPSYFLNEVCGPGTQYPCPGKGVPIFKPDSVPYLSSTVAQP